MTTIIEGRKLAERLGISLYRVDYWCRRKNLPFTKKTAQSRRLIDLDDFKAWAQLHKYLIADIERDRLLDVLQDESLVRQIKSHKPSKYLDWKDDEKEYLIESAGSMPPSMIVKYLNRANAANGYPPRTEKAVKSQMWEMGLSIICDLDNFSAMGLAKALGVDKDTVIKWIKLYGLKAKTVKHRSNNVYRISREDFKAWAKRYAHRLDKVERDNLLFVLDCPKLTDRILSVPKRKNSSRLVKNLETNEIFGSLTDAAIKYGLDARRICEAIRDGRPCGDYHWQYLETVEELTA